MSNNWKIFKKKTLHDGFYKYNEISFKYKKYNGEWTDLLTHEIFGGAHVASVLPYDPIKEKIILINQFRPGVLKQGYNPLLLEVVAGIINKNESPEKAALRECKEETGCEAKNLKKICSYFPSPGSSESYYNLFLAEVESFDTKRIIGQQDENEDILAQSYDVIEVKKLLEEGKISNSLTIIALQWFFLNYYKT